VTQSAAPQDGNTVTGYRTLGNGDVERMNRLKAISRDFFAGVRGAESLGPV